MTKISLFLAGILACLTAPAFAEPVTVPLKDATVTFDSSLLPVVPEGCLMLEGPNDPPADEGKPCDYWHSTTSGFYWGPKGEVWPASPLNPPAPPPTEPPYDGPINLAAVMTLVGPHPDIVNIACQGDIGDAVQAALDAEKWPHVGAGVCHYFRNITWTNGEGHFTGMGLATKITFRGTGCALALKEGEGGSTNTYIGSFKFFDQGTGVRHGVCVDGLSNNSVIDFIDFRGWDDQIRLRGALSDKSAAFYGLIRNIFGFTARGCNIRVTRPVEGGVSIGLLKIENVDIGRSNEGAICLEGIRTTDTAVVISGGRFDSDSTPNGKKMPIGIKVRGGFPTSGGPFAAFTVMGIDNGATNLFDSDIAVNVNLIGNSLSGNPAKPTFCGLAINLPGEANDVTCQAADGKNVSKP